MMANLQDSRVFCYRGRTLSLLNGIMEYRTSMAVIGMDGQGGRVEFGQYIYVQCYIAPACVYR